MAEADVEWLRQNNVAKTIDNILRQVMQTKPSDVPSAIAAAADNLLDDEEKPDGNELMKDPDFKTAALGVLAAVKFKSALQNDDDMQTAAAVSLAQNNYKEPEDHKSDGSAFASLIKSKLAEKLGGLGNNALAAPAASTDTDDEDGQIDSLAGAAFVALAKTKFAKALDDDTTNEVSTAAFSEVTKRRYISQIRKDPAFVEATYTQLMKKKLKKALDSDDAASPGDTSSKVIQPLLHVEVAYKDVENTADATISRQQRITAATVDDTIGKFAATVRDKFKAASDSVNDGYARTTLIQKLDSNDSDIQIAEFAQIVRQSYQKAVGSRKPAARKFARLAKKVLKMKIRKDDPDFTDAAFAALAAIKFKRGLKDDDDDGDEALNEVATGAYKKHTKGASGHDAKLVLQKQLEDDDDDPDFTTAAFVALAKTKFQKSLDSGAGGDKAPAADSDEEDDYEDDDDDDATNDVDFSTAAMAALATAKFKKTLDTETSNNTMNTNAMRSLMTLKLKTGIQNGSDPDFTTAAAVALAATRFKSALGEDKKTPSFKSVGLAALAKVKFSNSVETPEESAQLKNQTVLALSRTKFKDKLTNPLFVKEVEKVISTPAMKAELDKPDFQTAALAALAVSKFKKPLNDNSEFKRMASQATGQEAKLAVRREIRQMPEAEQQRWAAAVKKMMENTHGVGTSEFFRLAGYHGWPNNYCTHGQENFPAWHRAYLCDFEEALQKADKELGNDGVIGLPYWDWSDWTSSREVIPKIVSEHFSRLPADLADEPDIRIDRKPDWKVKSTIMKSRAAESAKECLHAAEHWKHASTRWVGRKGPSIEVSHNGIHVAVGWPMGSVKYAAFDPMFWLHHCNVDRIYEGYIKYETDSAQEFENQQAILVEDDKNEYDLWKQPLDPFTLPGTEVPFTCADTFDTTKLGYVYDKIPTREGIEVTEPPTMAVFSNVKIVDLNGKCYQIHVFVTKKGESFKIPADDNQWEDHDNYAGMAAVFGRGPGCEACEHRKPMDLFVPITDNLKKLGKSRYEVDLHVGIVDTSDPEFKVIPITDTPLPKPEIAGSLFDNTTGDVTKGGNQNPEDAVALQKFMKKYGYYKGAIDGDFGNYTNEAVETLQSSSGLKKDGVVGPNTKAQLKKARYLNLDGFTGHPDPLITKLNPQLVKNQPIAFWVGTAPGYINRKQYLSEVRQALQAWGSGLGWKFKLTKLRSKAALHFRFTDLDSGNNMFPFDPTVNGATLARANKNKVELDTSERWMTQRDKPSSGHEAFRLLPTLVHCVGAVLGLQHSGDTSDIMSPYYREDAVALTANDRKRIQDLYA